MFTIIDQIPNYKIRKQAAFYHNSYYSHVWFFEYCYLFVIYDLKFVISE